MEKKIIIYLVDDEDSGLETMESFIDAFFNKDNFEIECFHWAMSRSVLLLEDKKDPNDRIAKNAFDERIPHIVLTDINFQRELYRDGINFYSFIKDNYGDVEVIGITKNPTRNERELVAEIHGFDCFDKECDFDIIERRFVKYFKKVAIKIIKSIENPNEVIRSIKNPNSNIDCLKININNEIWVGKNLFAPYYSKKEGHYNINEILGELIPNFSLAASECFGIDGYKQATHHLTQGYYTENWYENLLQNLDKLQSYLDENDVDIDQMFVEYKEAITEFRKELTSKENQQDIVQRTINNYKDFRIGTSPNAKRKFMIKDLSLEKKLGGNEFEVYLPVDKIFEEQFTMLVQKTSLIGCFTFITDQQLYRQAETWLNDKHPLFCKEYLIFYMESEIPKNFTLPGFIDCFNKKKFSYFGKIYMYLKQDNIWYLYDVTHNRHLVTIDSLPNCLLKQIEEEQPTARTFILFEFLGWRQTN